MQCQPGTEPCRHPHGERAEGTRVLALVLALTATFTVVEAVGGLLTGSLALLADAGHMLSDDLSLGLALFAAWIARHPPTPKRSFGYRRAEVLAALANGVTLVAISIWIFVEAYERFANPPPVLGGWMLAVAAAGLVVNLVAVGLLSHDHGHEEDINRRAALWHVLADLLGSVGAIAAAFVILITDWLPADPLISALIGVLVLASSWKILKDSVNILMEATPEGIRAEEVLARMTAGEGVANVHDLHIWTITSGFPALTAHVLVKQGHDPVACRQALERMLASEYRIEHTTLQVDQVVS